MAAAPGAGGQGGGGMDAVLLDDIIRRLLEVRTARPGKQVQLSESEIRQLCTVSREIFLSQPNLLELEAPIKICGTCSPPPPPNPLPPSCRSALAARPKAGVLWGRLLLCVAALNKASINLSLLESMVKGVIYFFCNFFLDCSSREVDFY